MSDFLKTKRDEIAARLHELKPLVDEYHQLEAAAAALGEALAGLPAATRAARSARTAAAATPAKAKATATKRRTPARATRARKVVSGGRRGRPRGSGTRALQTLELVKS